MSFEVCTVWDFVSSHEKQVKENSLVGLWCFDAFVERLLLSRYFSPEKKRRIILGGELSVSLLENCFCQRDIFSQTHCLRVLQAERMPASSCEFMSNQSFKVESGELFLVFSKESSFFKTLSKKFTGSFFKLTLPKFWEGERFFEFLCKERNISLSRTVRDYLVNVLPMDSASYSAVLDQIKLARTETVSLDDVRSFIVSKKLDHFALANRFGRRKVIDFFDNLVSLDADFESLCFLFSFMQRHLLRLLDTSYIEKKKRPSRYDREVADHAVLWKADEIIRQMRLFGRLEILAKKRGSFLRPYLRMLSLSGRN